MGHGDQNVLNAKGEIHGAAHAGYFFAGRTPIGDIAVGCDLQGAEDTIVDMPAADHREGRGMIKETGARHQGDVLLTRIDQIDILITRGWRGSDAQYPVLAVEEDFLSR